MTDNRGDRGHEDRAESGACRRQNGMPFIETSFLEVVGEFHDQDAVLGDQSDQSDQSDLAVDIDGCRPEKGEEKGPRERKRHRTEQDDRRITEALELGSQHEEDEDQGEDHRRHESVSLGAELPRLAGVVDHETGGQNFGGPLFKHLESLVDRDAGRDESRDPCGVKLLEAVDLARFGAALQFGEGG